MSDGAAVRYTCVGSGTGVPRPQRGPACHLLEVGPLNIVLDMGSGSLRSLAGLGRDFSAIHAVGLTHRHLDHVADLLPLFFALRNTPGLTRTERLELFGYAGLRRDLERLSEIHGPWVMEPRFELRLSELSPGDVLDIAGAGREVRLRAHAVRHTPEALGFRIEIPLSQRDRGTALTFAYSGDTGATPELVPLADAADLFVCECAFPDGHGMEGHLTPAELLPILDRARPRQTVATHFYPVWDETGVDRLWREALMGRADRPDVLPARDGLSLDIRPPPNRAR